MPQPVRYTVRIQTTGPAGDLPGFLDMLRYDRATVRSWNRVDSDQRGNVYEVELEAQRPEIDRWKSFGLYPQVQS